MLRRKMLQERTILSNFTQGIEDFLLITFLSEEEP